VESKGKFEKLIKISASRAPWKASVKIVIVAKSDATSRAKEVDLNVFMEEARVMMTDLIVMEEIPRAWYEKKKQVIINQHA
jgi:hypothetical protein